MKRKNAFSLILTAALLIAAALSLLSPTLAHFTANETWSGRIPNEAAADETQEAELLVVGGQTVLLGEPTAELVIPLHMPTDDGYSVTVDGEGWVAELLYGTNVSLKLIPTRAEMPTEPVTAPPSAPTEATEVTEQPTEATQAPTEGPTKPTNETGREPSETTEQPTEATEPASPPQNAAAVTIRAAWTDGTTEKFADLILGPATERTAAGTVTAETEFYHPSIPLILHTGEAPVTLLCQDGDFPAGTRAVSETDGVRQTMLLYAPMPLQLPANAEAWLYLPDTEPAEDLVLQDEMQTLTLNYYPLPEELDSTTPILMGDSGLLLPLPVQWGSAIASAAVERLENDGTTWTEDETILCEENELTGELQFTPKNTPAGTYRATVRWQRGEETLYSLSFPFYVTYAMWSEHTETLQYRYIGSSSAVPRAGKEIEVYVTHYCACTICCGEGADGTTASGKKAVSGIVAMSEDYPFGTQIEIDGVLYTVEDRGGAITGNDVDIYVPTHNEAIRRGAKTVKAVVYLPAETDGE